MEDARPVIAFFDFSTHRDRTIAPFPGDLPPVGYSGFALSPDEHTLLVVRGTTPGGGIFSTLEAAAYPEPFERVFGTPHGADVSQLAAAAGLPYRRLEGPGELPGALAGAGLRVIEVRTSRTAAAALRDRLRDAAAGAVSSRFQ